LKKATPPHQNPAGKKQLKYLRYLLKKKEFSQIIRTNPQITRSEAKHLIELAEQRGPRRN
jgi:hypothetical protein